MPQERPERPEDVQRATWSERFRYLQATQFPVPGRCTSGHRDNPDVRSTPKLAQSVRPVTARFYTQAIKEGLHVVNALSI